MNEDSKPKSEHTLIVVLGMHRSGTSVVARAMGTLGGEFGERLMPPVTGVNDKGFFEDVDINAINVELLKAAGLDWYSMVPIDLSSIDPTVLDRLQTKAITVVRDKCAGSEIFVLKDPRLTRLVPFWRPVFECLNLRVVYVITVRSPISVAMSLARVHHFSEEKSYILWLAHLVAALEDTRNEERIFLDYDLLMDAPAHELARVSQAVGLEHAPRVEEFEREFLEDGLRNSRFSVNDLDVVRSAPPQVKGLVSVMRRAAAAEIDAYAPELDAAAQEGKRYLESIAPLLRYEWRLVQHLEKVTPALTDANARVGSLEAALRDSEERAVNVLREREAHAACTLRASEEHAANLLRASEARAAVEIAARDELILRLQQAVLEGEHALEEHLNRVEASQRYANDLKAQTEHLPAEVELLNSEREADHRTLAVLEAKVASQEEAIRQAGEEMARVFGSSSWRVTAPLRKLRNMTFPRRSKG